MKRWSLFLLFFSIPVIALALPGSALKSLETVHYDERKSIQEIEKTPEIKKVDTYILVLFFSNQCPHCVSFAPVVKQYAQINHLSIEPITLNGQTLPEFPKAQFATQEMIDLAYQGKPVVYPALFLANIKKHTLYPVSFGEMTYSELSERINLLKNRVVDYERSH
ncbi:conjugative transfer protein [Legionella santicrucis]|uniref:Conjugative transfer protein n=1 Tax=Legionella santicrucis TaxID=45074 RepID=A0A0W0ZBE0_9GAMM|nr:conjugal transfer protein TraF [Legionella santicrucis]KTD66476.1 conjugative transfer protein [Legionella santicrucis]